MESNTDENAQHNNESDKGNGRVLSLTVLSGPSICCVKGKAHNGNGHQQHVEPRVKPVVESVKVGLVSNQEVDPGSQNERDHGDLVDPRSRKHDCSNDNGQPLGHQIHHARPVEGNAVERVGGSIPGVRVDMQQHISPLVERGKHVRRNGHNVQEEPGHAKGGHLEPGRVKASHTRVDIQHNVSVGEPDTIKQHEDRARHGNVQDGRQRKQHGIHQRRDRDLDQVSKDRGHRGSRPWGHGRRSPGAVGIPFGRQRDGGNQEQNTCRDEDRERVLDMKGRERALGGKQVDVNVGQVEQQQQVLGGLGPLKVQGGHDSDHLKRDCTKAHTGRDGPAPKNGHGEVVGRAGDLDALDARVEPCQPDGNGDTSTNGQDGEDDRDKGENGRHLRRALDTPRSRVGVVPRDAGRTQKSRVALGTHHAQPRAGARSEALEKRRVSRLEIPRCRQRGVQPAEAKRAVGTRVALFPPKSVPHPGEEKPGVTHARREPRPVARTRVRDIDGIGPAPDNGSARFRRDLFRIGRCAAGKTDKPSGTDFGPSFSDPTGVQHYAPRQRRESLVGAHQIYTVPEDQPYGIRGCGHNPSRLATAAQPGRHPFHLENYVTRLDQPVVVTVKREHCQSIEVGRLVAQHVSAGKRAGQYASDCNRFRRLLFPHKHGQFGMDVQVFHARPVHPRVPSVICVFHRADKAVVRGSFAPAAGNVGVKQCGPGQSQPVATEVHASAVLARHIARHVDVVQLNGQRALIVPHTVRVLTPLGRFCHRGSCSENSVQVGREERYTTAKYGCVSHHRAVREDKRGTWPDQKGPSRTRQGTVPCKHRPVTHNGRGKGVQVEGTSAKRVGDTVGKGGVVKDTARAGQECNSATVGGSTGRVKHSVKDTQSSTVRREDSTAHALVVHQGARNVRRSMGVGHDNRVEDKDRARAVDPETWGAVERGPADPQVGELNRLEDQNSAGTDAKQRGAD